MQKRADDYQVKDPEKLIRIAKEWGVETEGKDIYDLAHEMADLAHDRIRKDHSDIPEWLEESTEAYTGNLGACRWNCATCN